MHQRRFWRRCSGLDSRPSAPRLGSWPSGARAISRILLNRLSRRRPRFREPDYRTAGMFQDADRPGARLAFGVYVTGSLCHKPQAIRADLFKRIKKNNLSLFRFTCSGQEVFGTRWDIGLKLSLAVVGAGLLCRVCMTRRPFPAEPQ